MDSRLVPSCSMVRTIKCSSAHKLILHHLAMGDHPIHHTPIPPPPPIQTSNISILYYSLVIVGTAAVVLTLYNFIILRCCVRVSSGQWSSQGMDLNTELPMSQSCRNMYKNCVYSFKYKKEGDEDSEHECAVCLSVFEEGEQLSQLPNCRHCFHADCIDMWLYSHMNCPLCRTSVEPPRYEVTEHYREGYLGSGQSSPL